MRQHFDLAGAQVRVDGALPGRARTTPVTRSTNSLRTRSAMREGFRAVRIAHHLRQAFAVAQVDEDHAAVVAPAVRPAAEA